MSDLAQQAFVVRCMKAAQYILDNDQETVPEDHPQTSVWEGGLELRAQDGVHIGRIQMLVTAFVHPDLLRGHLKAPVTVALAEEAAVAPPEPEPEQVDGHLLSTDCPCEPTVIPVAGTPKARRARL
jgi:hypothetical protein